MPADPKLEPQSQPRSAFAGDARVQGAMAVLKTVWWGANGAAARVA